MDIYTYFTWLLITFMVFILLKKFLITFLFHLLLEICPTYVTEIIKRMVVLLEL